MNQFMVKCVKSNWKTAVNVVFLMFCSCQYFFTLVPFNHFPVCASLCPQGVVMDVATAALESMTMAGLTGPVALATLSTCCASLAGNATCERTSQLAPPTAMLRMVWPHPLCQGGRGAICLSDWLLGLWLGDWERLTCWELPRWSQTVSLSITVCLLRLHTQKSRCINYNDWCLFIKPSLRHSKTFNSGCLGRDCFSEIFKTVHSDMFHRLF